MRAFFRHLGLTLAWTALGLHVFVMTCFAGRWDKTAAVTIFPIWIWAFGGLLVGGLGWLMRRGRLPALAVIVWLITLLVCPDEWSGLWRLARGADTPQQAKHAAAHVRVVTLNCQNGNIAAARETAAWHPDVILLQEMRPWREAQLRQLARELWGETAETTVVCGADAAILARGKATAIARTAPEGDGQFVQAALVLPGGREVQVMSLRLRGHVTDLRLHRWQTWRDHARDQRRRRLYVADIMAHQLRLGGHLPCLLGGDFNAPAGHRSFQTLEPLFDDTFARVGTGWGDTFPNKFPVLRIDQLWATREWKPIAARVVRSAHSDHRMLVADYVLE